MLGLSLSLTAGSTASPFFPEVLIASAFSKVVVADGGVVREDTCLTKGILELI